MATCSAWQAADDLFRVDSWVQVMLGQRLMPRGWHRIGALMSEGRLRQTLADLRRQVTGTVAAMPPQQQFLESYSAAPDGAR